MAVRGSAWRAAIWTSRRLPVGVLELGLCFGGDLRQNVPSPVDQALLAKRATEDLLAGAEQPRGGVADDEQRWSQPAADQLGQEVRPGVGGLGSAGGQPDQHRGAVGGDAPRRENGLGAGSLVHLEERAVQEQVV